MFLIHTVDSGHVPPFEYLPCSAITPKVGLAMALTDGQLAIASGTTKPEYICMAERSAAVTAGDIIPVIKADEGIVFETTAQADMAGVDIGDRVTIHTDGLQVTATTTNGVATVVDKLGDEAGDRVRVRFL